MTKHRAARVALALAIAVVPIFAVPVASTAGPVREAGEQLNPGYVAPVVKVCAPSGCGPADGYSAVIDCLTTCPVSKNIHLTGFPPGTTYVEWVEVLAPSELTYDCTPDEDLSGTIAVHPLGSTTTSTLSVSLPPSLANPNNLGWVCAHIGTAGLKADEVPVVVLEL